MLLNIYLLITYLKLLYIWVSCWT